MKVTRINTGIYKIENLGRTFKAEKTYDGQWMLTEFVENNVGMSSQQEYIEHYLDFKSCKVYVEFYL
tara:strand:- start:2474 stop:2674 length:201 start_codon:yes stop_codon:yes gene_type:complete